MKQIVAHIVAGRKIEAIKAFRATYGSCLLDAKNAVEAINDALDGAAKMAEIHERAHAEEVGDFVVISKPEYDYEYHVTKAYCRAEAMADANSQCTANEVIVARVIARSETVRTMKEVA